MKLHDRLDPAFRSRSTSRMAALGMATTRPAANLLAGSNRKDAPHSAGALEDMLQARKTWAALSSLLIMGMFLVHLGLKLAYSGAFAYGEKPADTGLDPIQAADALVWTATESSAQAAQAMLTGADRVPDHSGMVLEP